MFGEIEDFRRGQQSLHSEVARDQCQELGSYFRIVYRLAEDRTIEVVTNGPRRYVYEETYRQVRRENA